MDWTPTEPPLTGRRALVTGATGGLGWAIGSALAHAGCHIMLSDLGKEDDVEPRLATLRKHAQQQIMYLPADLSQESEITSLVATITEKLGGIDILINNAVVRHFAPVDQFDVSHWHLSLAVNLTAAFHTIRLTVPPMRASGWGRIINMSSIYGHRGAANRIDYITTKTALLGLTRAVAMETARDGITCNALCPGATDTPAIQHRINRAMAGTNQTREEAEHNFLAGKQPTGRFLRADNVASFVLFLCSNAACDITGAALPIDGGWSASERNTPARRRAADFLRRARAITSCAGTLRGCRGRCSPASWLSR